MKKIAVKIRKYINRISVLVTVFAILVTASFYNPASLASFSDNVADFPWRVVSPSLSGSWIVWNPSENNFGDRVSGASARGVYRSSGVYSPPNVSPAQSMVSVDFSLPFFLWPLPERTPSETFTVDGKFNVAVLIRLDSSVGSISAFCNPISVDGLLPDGVSISFFQTSGGFTLNSVNVISLNFQVVFDNVEFGPARDHLSFTLDFLLILILLFLLLLLLFMNSVCRMLFFLFGLAMRRVVIEMLLMVIMRLRVMSRSLNLILHCLSQKQSRIVYLLLHRIRYLLFRFRIFLQCQKWSQGLALFHQL